MLTPDEARIRNVVRFDARHSIDPVVVMQLALFEALCSEAIVRGASDFERILVDRLRSGQMQQAATYPRHARTAKGTLSELLVRAHQQALGRGVALDNRGVKARIGVGSELLRLGLLTEGTVPLSAPLLAWRRNYERAANDAEALGNLLTRALDMGLIIGDDLAVQVKSVWSRWVSALEPKAGTVLESALQMISRSSGLTAAELRFLTGANKSNVYRAIDELEEVGALVEVTGRKKDQVWLSSDLLNIGVRAALAASKSNPRWSDSR